MSTFREAMFHLIGITEDDLDTPHVDEYAGTEYVTPSIIREEE